MIFEIKSDLPQSTQKKLDAIEAIVSDQRTTTQAAFLTALAPYRTNVIISVGVDGLITAASGLTVPTGYSGFRKGATFIKTDATGNGLYVNTGDGTTSAWDLVDQASTTNIDDGAVTMAKLANIATATIFGRVADGTGVPKALSATEVRTAIITDGTIAVEKLTTSLALTGKVVSLNESTPVNAEFAFKVLTSDDTDVADGETVTIGTTVYRFKDTMDQAYDVQRDGTTADTTLENLIKAINATGTEGVEYYAGTLIHPDAGAGILGSHAFAVTAKVRGVAGNAIALDETSTHLSWGGGAVFLSGGIDGTIGVKDQIEVDITNLYICIAANPVSGTNWRKLVLQSL